jgi:WD40 repeat protein
MFGRTTLFFVIAVALIGVAWWYNPFGSGLAHDGRDGPHEPFVYGELIYPAEKRAAEEGGARKNLSAAFAIDPIIIPDLSLQPMHTMNVPSQQDGQIAWIGTMITDDEKVAKEFMAEQARKPASERIPLEARVLERGGKPKTLYFRPLKETDVVTFGQEVALVNPVKAIDKRDIAEAKVQVAKSQQSAAEKVAIVSRRERERLDKARGRSVGSIASVSDSEIALAQAQEEKAYQESQAKLAEIVAAEKEFNSAKTELNFYSIQNKIPGVSIIKAIEKKEGEAVKNLETVMQLQNTSLLRAEGMVDSSYLEKLHGKRKTSVRVEPSYETAPLKTLLGHRKEVTSVAVTVMTPNEEQKGQAAEPVIISASSDKYVFVWSVTRGRMLYALPHPEAVRVVAASPKGNLFLSGCADGSVRLWDLSKLEKEQRAVLVKDNPHRDAVTALAFSPDGQWFATGGADNLICLWHTQDASLVYPFTAKHGVDDPPQGQITTLTFTPQCELICAGRDNALRIWELYTKGAKSLGAPITDRSGTVAELGVSADGRWMLFDQGKTLQVMSVPKGETVAVVKKPSTATPFETLALISPDSKLILTAGAAEGRLQLWTAPTADSRAFEVRVLSPADRAGATCAAFAPAGVTLQGRAFAVSGTREGQVLIWPLPTDKEVAEAPVTGTLTLLDTSVEAGARQARIGVEVNNADGRLVAGKQATVVITP